MVLDLYMCIVQPTTYFNLGTTKVFSNMFCAFWYGISFTSAGFAILLPLLSTKEYTVLYIFLENYGTRCYGRCHTVPHIWMKES